MAIAARGGVGGAAMTTASARSAVAVLFLLVSACSSAERGCTTIGSISGVSVTVDRAVAANLATLEVRVCWDADATSTCRESVVELSPGTDSVDLGCDGSGPDAACAATVVPNGSKVGFVQLEGLPPGPINMAASGTVSGRSQTFPSIEKTASPSYPNGPDCDAGGIQATVTLGPDGLR